MFTKRVLPKIYCKITISEKQIDVSFYGLLGFKTINSFLKVFEKEKEEVKSININKYRLNLGNIDTVYHFLANENFIPISETFFYREMEKRDQISLS